MHTRSQSRKPRRVFLVSAGLILAHQVAGKAVRDGLFLAQFSPRDLPKAVVAAALLSVLLGLGFARFLPRYGPMRFVPRAFAVGSLLHFAEYALLRTAGPGSRGPVIVLVYLHLVGFGAVLLSGFWSMAGEAFNPREAKREFGRIAAVGTAGGVLGGVLAERLAALRGGDDLLVMLAVLHLIAWLTLRTAGAKHEPTTGATDTASSWRSAREAFRRAPFLVNLCVLVLIGAVSGTLLDYIFKSGAAAAYGRGPQLTRYFALFYTGSQLLMFLAQSFAAPAALRRLGLGRTTQWYPTAVAAGAGASLFLPPALMAPLARAMELVSRGSFFRSSYELFFTPVPPREKRATKMFIDVSCERMGDATGAVLVQLLLILGPKHSVTPILVIAAALGAIGFWITRRMDAAYSLVLERGLLNRAVVVGEADVQDSTTLAVFLQTTLAFSKKRPAEPANPAPQARTTDAVVFRLAELRSCVPSRIRAALAPEQPYDPVLAPAAIRLLAWDQSVDWARAFLLRYGHRLIGQLVDVLLDPEQDVAIRRKIPHILAYTTSQRAVDGLTAALADPRFEVRFYVSRALEFLHRIGEDLLFDREALMAAVERELFTSQSIRSGRVLVDRRDGDSQYWFLDEVIRDQSDKSLEYVFSLLAVMLPMEPLKVAFRALHSEDRMLRALGLEFLESHLSTELVSQLRHLVPRSAEVHV